ncbi:hypothetical protein HPT27_00860 [Permianibacter sp. IMCC34836]|uniref:COG4648 family protein n=1 Tax=Permianibacter fluminis TaxID=2738515 RepID=UPI001556154D|nr:hypothetical protein [Permianibacter fluminis]NQD35551.1 hypothetical protein [Permianibacter fluminis]
MRRLLQALAVGLLLLYPVLVFVGIQHWSPRTLATLLLLALLLRVLTLRSTQAWRDWRWPMLVAVLFALCAMLLNSSQWLRYYPVIISLSMLILFAGSLIWPPSIIARIARLELGVELDAREVRYTARLTLIWCGFFIINATVALLTSLQPNVAIWALYNGLLSYLLMGSLLFGERLFRARLRDWLAPQ